MPREDSLLKYYSLVRWIQFWSKHTDIASLNTNHFDVICILSSYIINKIVRVNLSKLTHVSFIWFFYDTYLQLILISASRTHHLKFYISAWWLCYINSTVNPFCYALCDKRFRDNFYRPLRCHSVFKRR